MSAPPDKLAGMQGPPQLRSGTEGDDSRLSKAPWSRPTLTLLMSVMGTDHGGGGAMVDWTNTTTATRS